MCKCLKELEKCLDICVIVSFCARMIFGILIAISSKLEKEDLILFIFSVLNSIALLIAFIFFFLAAGNADTYFYTAGGYRYTVTVDTSREDPEIRNKRYERLDFYSKNGMRIGYISLIFAIGVIEEYARIDEDYFDKDDFVYYLTFIMVTIFEIIFISLLLCSKRCNK